MKILLILTPIFVLVGLWLLIYSRRRSRLVKAFGETKGFFYRYRDDGTLEQVINRAFNLAAPLGRDFSRIRDIIEGDGIRLFRVTEALDLSYYGMPQNTHSHMLSVTAMRGKFLAYLEPIRTGSEKGSDLKYLLELAKMVKRTL